MNKITIAIVDDHQLFREGIHSLLTNNGDYQVVISANNGLEFFEALSSTDPPEVVLLDLTMPEMDGFEVLDRLRKEYPSIRSIALSMHDDGNYIVKCIKNGASGYLLKNTDEDEMLKAIRTVYRGGKYFNRDVADIMIHQMSSKESDTQKLSPKETEVLNLIAQGLTTKEIAQKLFISTRTVETHRVNIMKKLNARNTAETIKIAAQQGLID
jgi:DNA-binding NarL/FixJ family response regulator